MRRTAEPSPPGTGLRAPPFLNRSERLADRAHTALEEMIVTLQLAPGSSWSELALCERVQIGRTPVREALQRLALEQLVVVVPRHGILVTEINVQEQMMVVEMRRELDRLIATRAARRSRPDERARIEEYARDLLDMAEEGDVHRYLREHVKVRRFVADCARNKFAAAALSPLDALSRRFFFVHQSRPNQILTAGHLHAEALRAVAEGDETAAAGAADRLMDYIEGFTRATLEEQY